ncbi:MAG: hypothetical protein KC464_12100 [Myxococcales bacterium]|nr:hypothetical protein [Myxococcales bacterium]
MAERDMFDGTDHGPPGLVVTTGELATVLGLTDRQIRNLVAEGMPQRARGRFDLPAAVQWYVDQWRDRSDRSNGRLDSEERRALLAAQTRRAELEAAQLAGELEPRATAATVLMRVAALVADRLGAMPARRAPMLVGLDDVNAAALVLEEEVAEIRAALASELDEYATELAAAGTTAGGTARASGARGRRNPATTTEPQSRRVGRKRADATGRDAAPGTVA